VLRDRLEAVFLLLNICTSVGDGELVAVLQLRGEFNPEKMTPETWSWACQVTVHGQLKKNTTWEEGLLRESEEVGLGITTHLQNSKWHVLSEKIGQEEHVRTYGIVVAQYVLRDIRWGPASGGMRLLRQGEITGILNLRAHFEKTEGVRDRQVTAMFKDEREAVEATFKKFA